MKTISIGLTMFLTSVALYAKPIPAGGVANSTVAILQNGDMTCTGTIIDKRVILTTAACVPLFDPTIRVDVVFGTDLKAGKNKIIRAVGSAMHWAYTRSEGTDIGLVFLEKNIPQGYVPALLPKQDEKINLGSQFTFVRYGNSLHPGYETQDGKLLTIKSIVKKIESSDQRFLATPAVAGTCPGGSEEGDFGAAGGPALLVGKTALKVIGAYTTFSHTNKCNIYYSQISEHVDEILSTIETFKEMGTQYRYTKQAGQSYEILINEDFKTAK